MVGGMFDRAKKANNARAAAAAAAKSNLANKKYVSDMVGGIFNRAKKANDARVAAAAAQARQARESGFTEAEMQRIRAAKNQKELDAAYRDAMQRRKVLQANGYVPLFALLNTATVTNRNGEKNAYGKPKKYVTNKYKIFNNNGTAVTNVRNVREYSENERYAMAKPPPPPICTGETMNLKDMNPATSCFLKGMTERVMPALKKMDADRAAGVDACAATATKKMQPHQQGVFEVARAMATRTPQEMGGSRGLLVFHSTGSGKTVTSLGIMLAFWNSKRRIILATTPANKADNNLIKYAENMYLLFPSYFAKIFPGAPKNPAAVGAWVRDKNNIKALVDRVRTYTFTTLASELGKKGKGFGRTNPLGDKLLAGGDSERYRDGSVLIMDEVQSLFTPDPKYKEATDYLVGKERKLINPKLADRMIVFALTATPGNSVPEMLDVLNFVRPAGTPAFTQADASDPSKFAGLVSYVDIRSDTSRYGTKKIQNLYIPMDPTYYAAFLKTISLTKDDLDYAKLERAQKQFQYLVKQRTAGDFLNKTAMTGLISAADLARMAKDRIPRVVTINSSQQRILSPKLVSLLTNVLAMPGKQYIWVAELNTAKVVAAALSQLGFKQVLPKDFKNGSNNGKALLKAGEGIQSQGDRFILYKKGTADGENLDDRILKAYADYYDDKANVNGDRCKIMLATETYYQGLDLKALRGVHLVDALFNSTADKQAVGRALRLCGHSGAPAKNVMVHRYFSVPPTKFDPSMLPELKGAAAKKLKDLAPLDKQVRSLVAGDSTKVRMPEGTNARNVARYPGVNTFVHVGGALRQQPVTMFELGLKAFAVDCPLFKPYYHRTEPFQCGVKPSAASLSSGNNRNSLPGKLVSTNVSTTSGGRNSGARQSRSNNSGGVRPMAVNKPVNKPASTAASRVSGGGGSTTTGRYKPPSAPVPRASASARNRWFQAFKAVTTTTTRPSSAPVTRPTPAKPVTRPTSTPAKPKHKESPRPQPVPPKKPPRKESTRPQAPTFPMFSSPVKVPLKRV